MQEKKQGQWKSCLVISNWKSSWQPRFFRTEQLTDILSPFLSMMTLSLHLEIRKLTKLPKNWSGQPQSPPLQKWKQTVWHLSRWSLRLNWWNWQQTLKVPFFSSSPVAVMDPHSKSQERFSIHFWGCWLSAHRINSTYDCSQLRKCLEKGSRKKLKFSHSHTSPRATALTPPVSHLIKCLAILVFVIVFHAVYTKKSTSEARITTFLKHGPFPDSPQTFLCLRSYTHMNTQLIYRPSS